MRCPDCRAPYCPCQEDDAPTSPQAKGPDVAAWLRGEAEKLHKKADAECLQVFQYNYRMRADALLDAAIAWGEREHGR